MTEVIWERWWKSQLPSKQMKVHVYALKVIPYKQELILIFILCFSCIFKPGMNAILGPTGSGKSSYVSLRFSILGKLY